MQMNICAEKRKPRTIFLNVEITIQNATPIKAATFFFFATSVSLKKKKSLFPSFVSVIYLPMPLQVCVLFWFTSSKPQANFLGCVSMFKVGLTVRFLH